MQLAKGDGVGYDRSTLNGERIGELNDSGLAVQEANRIRSELMTLLAGYNGTGWTTEDNTLAGSSGDEVWETLRFWLMLLQ